MKVVAWTQSEHLLGVGRVSGHGRLTRVRESVSRSSHIPVDVPAKIEPSGWVFAQLFHCF